MMLERYALIGLVAAGALGALALAPEKTTTLEALRDQHRVLLIFASSVDDAKLRAQEAELRDHAQEARERDLVVVEVTGGHGSNAEESGDAMRLADPDAARKRFGVGGQEFTAVLVGKDGGEKLRSRSPLTMERLRTTIDAMPMRQDEMQKKQ
jgi:hypothetical protein